VKTFPIRFALTAAALLAAASCPTRAADSSPSPGKTPLEWSVLMANSQVERAGDKLDAAPLGTGGWDYTTGLFADALIRLSDATGNPSSEKSAEKTIGSFIGPDGKIATYQARRARPSPAPGESPLSSGTASPAPMPDTLPKGRIPYSLDEVQSGVATLKLYDITHDERYKKAADILRAQFKVHPRIPEGGFWHKAAYPNQMWLDGLYMGEPFYANYATRFNEPEDFDDIAKQFTLIGEHTYDPKTSLFYHGWDESKKQHWANPDTGDSPSFWGRAIGWYAMAIVDVLDTMPAKHPGRAELLDLLNKVSTGILKYQDPTTGVWWQVTDQGARQNNYLEASSSCMFVYALAKGVNQGYLPRTDIPAIRAGYQGLIRQFVSTDPDGSGISLTHICRVAGLGRGSDGSFDYYTLREPIVSNDLKGVGPFIDAGLECDKLFGKDSFAQ
jgi:unsaturated rhamnogalacturonyl hydrolase